MNPFEFANEIRKNRVQDEEYVKVSEMGGIRDDQYQLTPGQRIVGGGNNMMVYSSQKRPSPNVTMEFAKRTSARKLQS